MTKEEVKIEITKVMKLLNIDYMPTRSELERVGLGYLMNHIARKCGGFVALRNEMGLKEKPKSKSWAEESVIKEIKEVIRLLNLNYFPSKNQMESLEEYKHLPNIIYRNGGCRLWAEKVGVELEETETKFGNDQEEEVKKSLISRNYKVIDMTTNHPFDLLLNNNVRIDVKASHLYEGKLGKFYAFNLERKYHDCDIFFLRCINNQGEYRDLIIPASRVMGQKQISVGENKSKWYAYENKYDVIDKYTRFYEELN